MLNNLKNKQIILASQSPRRQELLAELGVKFDVVVRSIDENYPEGLSAIEIAEYLAHLKAKPFEDLVKKQNIIITADTIVALGNKILGKPKDKQEAFDMLKLLSGKKHQVVTGVCITSSEKQKIFSGTTSVYFKELTHDEIQFYVESYLPMDKAGSYGIQEWIGYIGVEKIEGSYFNVMGLPVHLVYEKLKLF